MGFPARPESWSTLTTPKSVFFHISPERCRYLQHGFPGEVEVSEGVGHSHRILQPLVIVLGLLAFGWSCVPEQHTAVTAKSSDQYTLLCFFCVLIVIDTEKQRHRTEGALCNKQTHTQTYTQHYTHAALHTYTTLHTDVGHTTFHTCLHAQTNTQTHT